MDNKTKTIILLAILLLLVTGYLTYNLIYQSAFTRGYNQGSGDLIYKINNERVIPIIQQNEFGNQTINFIRINDICGGN